MLPYRQPIKTRHRVLNQTREASKALEETSQHIGYENRGKHRTGNDCLLGFCINSLAIYKDIIRMQYKDVVSMLWGNMWGVSMP